MSITETTRGHEIGHQKMGLQKFKHYKYLTHLLSIDIKPLKNIFSSKILPGEESKPNHTQKTPKISALLPF